MPAVRVHHTPTSDANWDGPANEARLRSGEGASYYERAYAWRDPDGDPQTKAAWRFIHHEVSADGEPGAANLRACRTGIAVLNGARGGTTIPEADYEGVYRHLAAHLRDAGIEPPELRAEGAVERRSLPMASLRSGDMPGTFSGYASAFDVEDAYGDVIAAGAFAKTLVEKGVRRPLLWHHDPAEPIGWIELAEDASGLRADGRLLLEIDRAREAYALMQAGVVAGLSIGFIARGWDWLPNGARRLTDIDLYEVSLTVFPANPAAKVSQVRACAESQSAAPAIHARGGEEDSMTEHIQALEQRIRDFTSQAQSEIARFGAAQDNTVAQLTELSRQLGELRRQVDAIDARSQRAHEGAAATPAFFAEDHVEQLERLSRDRRGVAVLHFRSQDLLERRTTITSGGISIRPQRLPDIVPEARRQLRIRNLLTTFPAESNKIEFVRVSSHAKVVSPQTEAALKAENEITFALAEAPVQTIATWIPATKQVLEDVAGLQAFIESSLLYALEEKFEDQLLLGSGTSPNLNGLVTQASTFQTSLLGTSWGYADVIGRAVQQIGAANEVAPTFVVLHTADAWNIRLSKDNYGQYIFGPPNMGGVSQIFGLDMVVSNAISSGQFLVGSAAPNAAHIRLRHDATVEISTEHSDYFVRNMVAIRAELRAALVVMRPAAFVKGSVTRSPAN